MTGIVLMLVGFLCFIVGLFLYSSSNTSAKLTPRIAQSVQQTTKPIERIVEPLKQAEEPTLGTYDNDELEKVVNMAIVDGVLTAKEREYIKQIVHTRGLDCNEVMENVESRFSQSFETAETELIDINKKNGFDFEKFIVQKFNKRFFKVKQWAGDKYANGTYAETTLQPDLLLELSVKNQTNEFAVECKWRSGFFKGGIEVAKPDQYKRYQNYEANKKVPVFIAIGIGGKAANPEKLYIVPLQEMESGFISYAVLKKFQKKGDKDFFFEPETQRLN